MYLFLFCELSLILGALKIMDSFSFLNLTCVCGRHRPYAFFNLQQARPSPSPSVLDNKEMDAVCSCARPSDVFSSIPFCWTKASALPLQMCRFLGHCLAGCGLEVEIGMYLIARFVFFGETRLLAAEAQY